MKGPFIVILLALLSLGEVQAQPANMHQQRLSNGLHVIHQYRPYAKTVTLQIVVNVGLADFPCESHQVPHVLEHMLLSQTQDYSEGELRKTVKDLGGTINGFTTQEYSHYTVTLHSDSLHTGVDLLHSVIFSPKLSSTTLRKSISAVHTELGTSDSQLKNLINDTPSVVSLGVARLYANSHLDCDTKSLPTHVQLADTEDAYDRFYHPVNMTLILVGNVRWQAFTQHHLQRFIDTPAVPGAMTNLPDITPLTTDTTPIEENNTFSESRVHINLLLPASGKNSGNSTSYKLISDYLGEQLFYDLRTDRGIAYSPRANYIAGSDLGYIHATAETTSEWEDTVTQRFLGHYAALHQKGIPASDIERLKKKAILRYESKERKNIDIVQHIRHHRHTIKNQGYMPDTVAEIRAISPASIQQLITQQWPAEPVLATLRPLENHQLVLRILLIVLIAALVALPVLRRARKRKEG